MAEVSDLELAEQWSLEMHHEIFGRESRMPPPAPMEKRIHKSELYLWEDDVPVSMAAKCRPLNKGITINAVYTPVSLRKKGYATSCVYSLSQLLLESGYEYISLFTDLANPTSNSIYQAIGFRPVCDSLQVTLK